MSKIVSLFDGLRNLVSGVGTSKDKSAAWSYVYVPLTTDQIDAMYASDWLARKIVDIIPADMTREWREWEAEQAEAIYAAERDFKLQSRIKHALTLARLYGGSAILIGDGASNPRLPLDVRKFKQGGLKYLHVFSRHELSGQDKVTNIDDPDYGKPLYFRVNTRGNAPELYIHRSRFVFFNGPMAPNSANIIDQDGGGWGMPVLQIVQQAVINVGSSTANAAVMTEEAKLDVISIPDLHNLLSTRDGTTRLIERFALANTLKSTVNTLLLGGDEKFDRKQVNFGGLPELINKHLDIAAGAADIPMTRLMGQSPGGLNSTGESDLRNYYDMLRSRQTTELQDSIEPLDEVLVRHVMGDRPDEVVYSWNPLWALSEKERAEIGKIKAEATNTILNTNLLLPEELRPAVIDMLVADSFYPTLDQHVLNENEFEKRKEEEEAAEAEAAEAEFKKQLELQRAKELPPPPKNAPQLRLVAKRDMKDATPKTLYVHRKVLNWKVIAKWAKSVGFETTLGDDMHVTIAYSRAPVDWMKISESYVSELKLEPGGPRMLEKFGEAKVLLFKSFELEWRHQAIIEAGASWDHPEYQPHITISYGDSPDLESIDAYQGEIILGPEIFQELDEDWSDKVTEDRDIDPFGVSDFNPNQPRDPKGTSTGGQWKGSAAAMALEEADEDKEKWPQHIKDLKLPPGWQNIRYSLDPNAALLAVGRDAAGRGQYVYSPAFVAQQQGFKFARVKELATKVEKIREKNNTNRKVPALRDHADAQGLVMGMGLRPGSTDDTGAKVKAYGATTLEGRHVVVDGDDVRLRFTGKKGVNIDLAVTDKATASMLRERAKEAGDDGRLFPNVSDRSLLEYNRTLAGDGFKSKDYRTLLATQRADELVKSYPKPTNERAYKKAVLTVAKQVSQELGNTPTVALQSYIHPAVFAPWRS